MFHSLVLDDRRHCLLIPLGLILPLIWSVTCLAPFKTQETEIIRFALGTAPQYCIPHWAAEAPECCFDFDTGDAPFDQKSPGEEVLLTRPGVFHGTCGGRKFDRFQFESTAVQNLRIDIVGINTNLALELGPYKEGSIVLDAAHPDWTVSLLAVPFDEKQNRLRTGRSLRVRWKMNGCGRIIESVPYETDAFLEPGDSVRLAPIGFGQCTIDAEYRGIASRVAVKVR